MKCMDNEYEGNTIYRMQMFKVYSMLQYKCTWNDEDKEKNMKIYLHAFVFLSLLFFIISIFITVEEFLVSNHSTMLLH